MESFSDVITSMKATLYERISNPLLSSFLISWFIWNYKFVLVFLSSSMETIEKIEYIKNNLFPFCFNEFLSLQNGMTILFLLIGPIGTSLLYLYIIYPMLGKKVYEDHKEHIREYEEIKVKIEGKTSMSDEDVLALKSEHRVIRGIVSKQLDEKDTEINFLKQDLEKVTAEAASSLNQLSRIQGQQNEFEKTNKELANKQDLNVKKQEKIEHLLAVIEALEKEVTAAKNNAISQKTSDKSSPDNNVQDSLSKDAVLILKMISNERQFLSGKVIEASSRLHRLRYDDSVKSLVGGEYVKTKRDNNGKLMILINAKGEQYLLDNKLI
jgi:hypothetical protein